MLDRLVNSFIEHSKEKTTKRGIEWIMADFIYCVYILIMLIGMLAFISFDVWWAMLIVAVSFMIVLSGWGTFAYYLRKTLLGLLYPPTPKTDENGDSDANYLDQFGQILNDLKNEFMEIREEKV